MSLIALTSLSARLAAHGRRASPCWSSCSIRSASCGCSNGLGFMEAGPGARVEVLDPLVQSLSPMDVETGASASGSSRLKACGARLVLIGFSLAIASIIAFWLTRAERSTLQALAFGLIIGGAIGNVIDRIAYGAVAIFSTFSGLWFPYVFNVAGCSHLGGRGRPYSRPVIERDRQEERCLLD